MSAPLPIRRLTIWCLAIPMREKFEHATAGRAVAEPLVVGVELADGAIGYGETHPREYVTGETAESAVAAIRDTFVPGLVEIHPANFGEAIEVAANLPFVDSQGRVISAARAAVELALLDAYARAFGRSFEAIAGWLGESWLGSPGSSKSIRFSGVLSGSNPKRTVSSLRKMRCFGLRDFKLKVGDDSDEERLQAVIQALHRPLANGRATLRLDANGAWSLDQALAKLRGWQDLPIASVEQPLAKGDWHAWQQLASDVRLPLMADESLVTPDDAEAIVVHRAAKYFNIRISKNGGLIPAMQFAETARRHGLQYQLGCMVGETSILSAAGRWFLQLVPDVQFAEGSFGKFLLKDDVTANSLRFGYGGRWPPMTGHGLGVEVREDKLQRLSMTPPTVLHL